MKAKKLLELIVNYQLNIEQMGYIYTPERENDELKRAELWACWFFDWFRSNEVCILDEDTEYLYYYANESEYEFLDKRMECWITNENGERVYLFKVE